MKTYLMTHKGRIPYPQPPKRTFLVRVGTVKILNGAIWKLAIIPSYEGRSKVWHRIGLVDNA